MSNYMNFDRTKKGSGNVAAPVFGGYSLDNIDPDLLAKQVTVKVRVPLSVVGLVVGPRGSKIKHIQNFTQTYIVTPSRNKDPVFEITGLKENVAKAREEIESWIAVRTGSDVIEDVDPLDEFKMNGSEKNLEEDDAKFDSFRPEPSSNLPTNFTERNLIHQNPLRSKLELANHSTTENTRHPSSSTTDSYQDEEESKNQAILALQNLTDKEKIRLGEVIEQFKHEKKNKIQAPPVTQKLAVGTRQPLTKKELNNPTIMPIFEPKKKKNVSTDNVLISKLDPEAEKNRDRRADNFKGSKLYNKSQPASLGHFSMDKIVQNSDQPGKRLLQKVAMGENNSPENYPADPRYPGYSPRAPYHPDGYGYEPYDPYYGAPRGPMPPSHAYGYPPAGNYGYPPHPHHAYGAGYGYPPAHPYPPHPYGYPEHAADPNYYPPESHGPYGMPGYNYDHSGHYGYESGPPGTHRGDSARLHPKKSEKLPIKPAENLNKSVDSKTSHKNSTGISISSIEFHPASSTPLSAITDNLEKSEDAISDVNSMGNLPASKTLTLTQEADSFTTVKGVSKAGKCLVCREQPISMALVPCGHNLFCEDCAYMITQGNKKNLSDNNPVCPECFEPVNMAIRIKM